MNRKYLLYAVLLIILTGILCITGKDLLQAKATDADEHVDTKRHVVPIRTNLLQKSLKDVGTVTISGDEVTIVIPANHKDKIAVDKIVSNPELYGATVEIEADHFVLILHEGPRSTVLVPIPTIIALIDREILSLKQEKE